MVNNTHFKLSILKPYRYLYCNLLVELTLAKNGIFIRTVSAVPASVAEGHRIHASTVSTLRLIVGAGILNCYLDNVLLPSSEGASSHGQNLQLGQLNLRGKPGLSAESVSAYLPKMDVGTLYRYDNFVLGE